MNNIRRFFYSIDIFKIEDLIRLKHSLAIVTTQVKPSSEFETFSRNDNNVCRTPSSSIALLLLCCLANLIIMTIVGQQRVCFDAI